jgi:peptidoglycan/xylan/chitin deacetylase (PgdA/CDA1 family)
LLTLMFHGVVGELPAYAQFGGGRTCLLPRRNFERIIEWCAGEYGFIRADQLADYFAADRDEARVLVTFDDGLASMCDHALPVLERHGASALVFVTTDWVRGGRTPAIFLLERQLWEAPPRRLRVTSDGRSLEREVGRRGAVADAMKDVWAFLFSTATPPLVLDASQVHLDGEPWRPDAGCQPREFWHPATWAELRQGVEAGLLEIGAHGVTHRPWPSLSDDALQQELAGARDELRARVGADVISCSYPHGMVDDRVAAATATVYRWAFTNEHAAATADTPPARMPRIHVPSERPFWIEGIVRRPRAGAVVRRLFQALA